MEGALWTTLSHGFSVAIMEPVLPLSHQGHLQSKEGGTWSNFLVLVGLQRAERLTRHWVSHLSSYLPWQCWWDSPGARWQVLSPLSESKLTYCFCYRPSLQGFPPCARVCSAWEIRCFISHDSCKRGDFLLWSSSKTCLKTFVCVSQVVHERQGPGPAGTSGCSWTGGNESQRQWCPLLQCSPSDSCSDKSYSCCFSYEKD